MYRLSKLGFTQSYTYFTWRNTKQEIVDYFTELTGTSVREFFRPNLWPNTPDILPESLQFGGRPAFIARLILAGTLGASYGIYGPAYEMGENDPREPGSEEYRNSEKYEIKDWNLDDPTSLKYVIRRLNQARRENPALQSDWGLRFHSTDNEALLCYSKSDNDSSNAVIVVINLDPRHAHSGWVTLDLAALGIAEKGSYQLHDLLSDRHLIWNGPRNFLDFEPETPACIFQVRRKVRTEHDFDYFL
jgi:starch synthase (maltosyl-transferring)